MVLLCVIPQQSTANDIELTSYVVTTIPLLPSQKTEFFLHRNTTSTVDSLRYPEAVGAPINRRMELACSQE